MASDLGVHSLLGPFCPSIYRANTVIQITFFLELTSLDKRVYPVNIFSYFSMKLFVVGTHKQCRIEALLMSTQNVMF